MLPLCACTSSMVTCMVGGPGSGGQSLWGGTQAACPKLTTAHPAMSLSWSWPQKGYILQTAPLFQVSPQPRAWGHTRSLLVVPESLAWYTYVWCVVSMNTWLWMSQNSVVAPVPGQATPSTLRQCIKMSCLLCPSTSEGGQ